MKDRFFVYCNESGFDCFETLDEALDEASERTQEYLVDGWSEEVTSVCVGKITHRAKMCDQLFPVGKIDADGFDEEGEHWDPDCGYKCNYKMMPVEHENPADGVSKLAEPAAWLVREKTFCGDVTTNKDAAEFCEQLSPNSTTPLYAHPQPAADVTQQLEILKLLQIMRGLIGGAAWTLDEEELELAKRVEKATTAIAGYRQQGGDV